MQLDMTYVNASNCATLNECRGGYVYVYVTLNECRGVYVYTVCITHMLHSTVQTNKKNMTNVPCVVAAPIQNGIRSLSAKLILEGNET